MGTEISASITSLNNQDEWNLNLMTISLYVRKLKQREVSNNSEQVLNWSMEKFERNLPNNYEQ